MDTTGSAASQAGQTWHTALKLRKRLLKVLEQRNKDADELFEAVDKLLGETRLACMGTIFLDFEYAAAQNAEQTLWSLHTSINASYRRVLTKARSLQPVEKRKLEKMYNNFLRISQQFYKGYVQRLSARYDVPELRRAAQGMELEPLSGQDMISPLPDELNRKVLESCHSTLIHLGDLARYRLQARHKTSFDAALVYYSLAHDLRPNSGFAFHQMGIVNLEQNNHLDVVYSFYRAATADTPHPNAISNLEAEFKTLETPSPSSTSKTQDQPAKPDNALLMWFVRLHALFYKGETSTKHEAMEKEVLYQLDAAARKATSSNSFLKMTIVNISAYHIAMSKFSESHNESAIRFCQYTLRFNGRFVLSICSAIESALTKASADGREESSGMDSQQSEVVSSLLPVLRIYAAWVVARRTDLFNDLRAFGPVIPEMMQGMARVYTLLCTEAYSQQGLGTCPYLLPEDLDILGLQPFNNSQIPEACRSHCLDDGSLKPRAPSLDSQLGRSREGLARILDILRCAYFMAEDHVVPLRHRVTNDCLMFEIQTDAPSPQLDLANHAGESATHYTPAQTGGAGQLALEMEPAVHETLNGGAAESPREPGSETRVFPGDAGVIDDAENTVLNMLAPFLRPPTPQLSQTTRSLQRPMAELYGTPVAREAAITYPPDASPSGSASHPRLEPLPWDWLYTPTPRKDQEATSNASREAFSYPQSPAHSSRASGSGILRDDPFTMPSHSRSVSGANQDIGQATRPDASASASDESHRDRQLQFFNINSNHQVPRQSAFSNWGQGAGSPIQQPTGGVPQSPWAAASSGGHQCYETTQAPSDASMFSTMTGLLHGTPNNGANYGLTTSASARVTDGQTQGIPNLARKTGGAHFTMDETASTYDAAILQSAFYDK